MEVISQDYGCAGGVNTEKSPELDYGKPEDASWFELTGTKFSEKYGAGYALLRIVLNGLDVACLRSVPLQIPLNQQLQDVPPVSP